MLIAIMIMTESGMQIHFHRCVWEFYS